MRALLLLLAGCAAPATTGFVDVVETRPSATPIAPAVECVVTTARAPAPDANHIAPCSPLELDTMPPVSGTHYGSWADFRTYDAPVPWGFLLHAMEHGAVLLAYDCPAGCPEVVALFETLAAERDDPLCRGNDRPNRIVITPATDLGAPVAALAWEHAYTATCLDEASLRAFVDARYAQAPEDLCVPGTTTFCP
ncbi:MAG: DUF3105 domain-containing protein [Sandaracinaceae bacterium]|nr:DUF3105 domain-containing protein [Sandaracinaceae bacterium]